MQSFKLKFLGVTILQGVEFPIFLLIFAWALQQCSATALPVMVVLLQLCQFLPRDRLMCVRVCDAKVHITGTCNGHVFEDRDVTFTMGCGSDAGIVPGVEMALKKFHQGEISRLKVSSQYGYGSEGCAAYDIAADAELTYQVNMKQFVRVIMSHVFN